LAGIATLGLVIGLPSKVGQGGAVATLQQRFAVMRKPAVLQALLMTTLWSTGTYALYTYLATFLGAATHVAGPLIGVGFFLWGTAAAVGVFLGGTSYDKFGSVRVILVGLPVLAATLIGLSIVAHLLSPQAALLPMFVGIVIWGIAAWAIHPAQQARLIEVSGSEVAPVALSLNASFLYLGFALGAALGSFVLSHAAPADLGWTGGLCEVAALALMWSISRPHRSVTSAIVAH